MTNLRKLQWAWLAFSLACMLGAIALLCGCGPSEAGGRKTTLVIRHPQGTWDADELSTLSKNCSGFVTDGLRSWACPGYTIREVEILP